MILAEYPGYLDFIILFVGNLLSVLYYLLDFGKIVRRFTLKDVDMLLYLMYSINLKE